MDFIVVLEKCPQCGKRGLLYGHWFDGTEQGWIGVKCVKCGYTAKDEKAMRELLGSDRNETAKGQDRP